MSVRNGVRSTRVKIEELKNRSFRSFSLQLRNLTLGEASEGVVQGQPNMSYIHFDEIGVDVPLLGLLCYFLKQSKSD